jgi:cellobiose transport system substrate-binding protein
VTVPRISRTKTIAVGSAAVLTLVLASCSSATEAQPADGASGGEVTVNLSTFGNFGYSDELIASFEEAHPNIDVVHNIASDGTAARTNLFTKLAAGSGLADVEAVEINWTVDLAQYADKFVPVPADDGFGDWLDIQKKPVTTKDGALFAYGVAIGPTAICYRADLFAAAGLPTEPAEVATLLDGGWDNYFTVGEKFKATGATAGWFDSAASIYGSLIQQQTNPYEKDDGTIIATTNPEVEDAFRTALSVASTLSAGLDPWTDDWYSAMNNGDFATMGCPSWMLGIIEGAAPDETNWRIADTYPGGGGNAGGSFLVVPTQSKHPKEAAELASWLTAPEQQVTAFSAAGPFPSRLEAFDLPELQAITSPYFGNAPIGEIFTARAKAIKADAFKGPHYFQIDAAINDAFSRAADGTQSVDDAWNQFVDEVNGLG